MTETEELLEKVDDTLTTAPGEASPPADTLLNDSPFGEEVIQREYTSKSGPKKESALPPPPKKNVFSKEFTVEDDEDYLRFQEMDEKSKAAYDDQDQEMGYVETEDATADVLESTRIHQGIVDSGRTTLSEQIYTNLSTLVPEALHEFSRVKESKFSEQGWDKDVVDTTLREIQQHNADQRKKFTWGELHETNIKKPLRHFLMEQGLEDAMSPGGQLLFGLTVVALVTWITFKDVKAQNRNMERRLLAEIQRIVNTGSSRRGTAADGKD